MTKNEVKTLLDYGFSVTEIAEMEKPAPAPASSPALAPASSPAPAPTSSPAPAPASSPAPAPTSSPAPAPASSPALAPASSPDDVSNRDLLAAVTRLTNMMALANVRNTTINTPEPDVTAQLNSLFAKSVQK